MDKYRKEYHYVHSYPHYKKHIWLIECAQGAVHLHITDLGEKCEHDRYSGGIETHYRKPPDHMATDSPSQNQCWIFGGSPCWHDGSSLYASEHFVPMWEMDKHDHDGMFNALIVHMHNQFHEPVDA